MCGLHKKHYTRLRKSLTFTRGASSAGSNNPNMWPSGDRTHATFPTTGNFIGPSSEAPETCACVKSWVRKRWCTHEQTELYQPCNSVHFDVESYVHVHVVRECVLAPLRLFERNAVEPRTQHCPRIIMVKHREAQAFAVKSRSTWYIPHK